MSIVLPALLAAHLAGAVSAPNGGLGLTPAMVWSNQATTTWGAVQHVQIHT